VNIVIDDPVKIQKEKEKRYKEPFVYLKNTKKNEGGKGSK